MSSLPGMATTGSDPERNAKRAARRAALAGLARSVRALIDATVNTDLEPGQIERITSEIDEATSQLNARRHAGKYSGLLGRGPFDHTKPVTTVPLSPWAGPFNPIAPPIEVQVEKGEVYGRVRLGKAYIGPPDAAHGGVVAGIMDQLLASCGQSAGVAGLTAHMTVRFRKPTPLFTELTLHAWADPRSGASQRRRVHAEIKAGDTLTAEGEALVIRPRSFGSSKAADPGSRSS